MGSVNYHLRQIGMKQSKILSLQNSRSTYVTKVSKLRSAINSANSKATKTKSASTLNSKLKEADRKSRELATAEKKIADIDTKIVREQKALNREEQLLEKAKARETQKHLRKTEETMSDIAKLKQLPKEITVLFLALYPINDDPDEGDLRLDEEARSITEMFRKSKHRDVVKFQTCWALRTSDLFQAMNEYAPTIIHFSGHGTEDDEIVFQDDQGNPKCVSKDAVVQVMMASGVRLVFFNTCFSSGQAEAVVEHVECSIGMNDEIGDDAARFFASQFYSAIGFGMSVKQAFHQGKTQMMLENTTQENIPELFVADGLNADDIILVQPEESN